MTDDLSRRQDPEVTIIVPVHNDAEWVGQALESCLAQTLRQIEVIVVDDASTDDTASIVEAYQARDARIRLIRQETNGSAFRARRLGIEAATAPYVLFLDGDDELVPEAASTALGVARAEGADVVGFGSKVIRPSGGGGGRYEAAMQPKHRELAGVDILDSLFPIGVTAQGQLWRYLFDRRLLVDAYASLPRSLVLPRVNDLPIVFLVLMRARKYVSTEHALYHYFFRRGASGHQVQTIDDYLFTASAINSVEAIAEAVAIEAAERPNDVRLIENYESTRLSVIGRVLEYVCDIVDETLQEDAFNRLEAKVGSLALALACADFCPKALPLLAAKANPARLSRPLSRHVVLRTGNLRTGGVQAVLVAQAGYLVKAGYRVTVVVDSVPETAYALPDGVNVLQIDGKSRAQRVAWFVEYCREHDVALVIDHHILYNERWPHFALAFAVAGIPMVGWLHNFALRPIMDGNDRLSFLERYLPLLAKTVVLSSADVAYWKLRGVDDVLYLPNPPSPFLESLPIRAEARRPPAGVIEIVWWGRLQESTKQVSELIQIGSILRDEGIDFRLTLIGPDSPELSAAQVHDLAVKKGIDDRVELLGERRGADLFDAIDHAHIFVSTSAIEGYPLALVEAQAFGLPIVMYDLPWLAFLADNAGVASVAQGDRRAAARAIASLTDAEHYTQLSKGALAAARTAVSHDFVALYDEFVSGNLPAKFSPSPTTDDMRLLLEQHVVFVERLIRREQRAVQRARDDARGQRKKAIRLGDELREARADALGHRKKVWRLSTELHYRGLRGLLRRVKRKLKALSAT